MQEDSNALMTRVKAQSENGGPAAEPCQKTTRNYRRLRSLTTNRILHQEKDPNMLNEWSIDGYYESYNWLLRCDETSKEKGRAAESANQLMAEFLSVWKRKAPDVFKEAIELMAYCAEHEFINMTPTLKERIDGDWKETGTDEDKEGLYIKLLPYPMMLYRMFQDEKCEETFANVFYLFERLADLEKRRPEMFRNVNSYMAKMEIISDLLLEVYFQIKGCPNVNSDMKGDIDFFIMELQGRYNYFNETSSRWDDMFHDENKYYGHLGDFWEWDGEEVKRRNIEVL